jgi:LacI family transcriptional regulator
VRDVAARAGVSVGTVSRVLNDYPDVSPSLRARVQAAMRELAFQPNALARNFRQQRSHTVGVVVPDITAPFFADLVKQIEAVAIESGYTVVVGNSANIGERENAYLAWLSVRGVDGLVIAPTASTDNSAFPLGSSIVVVDHEIDGLDLVACDHEAGAREAVEHLRSLGHRLIACITGPQPVFRQRLAGYRTVMRGVLEREGVDPVLYVREEPPGAQWGLDAAHALLRMEPRPTAIFAASDQQAVGVLRACADLMLAVPDEVSVVGFDDIPLAQLLQPRLTTVRQPTAEIGRLVVERLLHRLDGSNGPPSRDILPGTLLVRQSSGRLSTAPAHGEE